MAAQNPAAGDNGIPTKTPDADTNLGGAGADLIQSNAGGLSAQAVTGAASTGDTIRGNEHDNVLRGGKGDDLIYGGGGNDTLQGGSGDDTLYGGTGHDELFGGLGNDELYGDSGDDTLSGGLGDDRLYGGAGNDVIYGGLGANTISGGEGDDLIQIEMQDDARQTIIFRPGEGNDTIVGAHAPTSNSDGSFSSNLFIDVAGMRDNDDNPITSDQIAVSPVTSGENTWVQLAFPNGQTLLLQGPNQTSLAPADFSPEALDSIFHLGLSCFTRGTMLRGKAGDVAVEALAVGDLVETRDNGLQAVRWIGRKALRGDKGLSESLRPIRIRAGALGAGLPAQDLTVSPQHRILVRSNIAQRMFGAREVLVAAKQLLALDGVEVLPIDSVEYFHILFDRHEIVWANGAETESLYTGAEALKSVGKAARDEIFAIFPELRDGVPTPAARPLVSGRRARKLTERHRENGHPLA